MASANNVLPLNGKMYCYLWKEVNGVKTENKPFPGEEMTFVEDKFQTYGLNGVVGKEYTGCIFSDGTSLNQTVNTFEYTDTIHPTKGYTFKITGKENAGEEVGHYNGILVDLNALLKANNG